MFRSKLRSKQQLLVVVCVNSLDWELCGSDDLMLEHGPIAPAMGCKNLTGVDSNMTINLTVPKTGSGR